MLNIVDILRHREHSSSSQSRHELSRRLEENFTERQEEMDFSLHQERVLSTIATAFSPDGTMVASTHGDHSVKLFLFDTAKLIHVFHGHPRTPWTVKFHPNNSNLLASGCLGAEVRVWDIKKRVCRSLIKASQSIISLSFQPNGDHIAFVSGAQILLWDWRHSAVEDSEICSNGTVYPNQLIEPVFVHCRNIRAIVFHPLGYLAFIAAPDPSLRRSSGPSPCRLYSCKFPLVGTRNNVKRTQDGYVARQPAAEVDTLPSVIPQIHLYSDGGIDISMDGQYIIVGGVVAKKKAESPHYPPRSPPVPLPAARRSEDRFSRGCGVPFSVFSERQPPLPDSDDSTSDFSVSDDDQNNDMLSACLEDLSLVDNCGTKDAQNVHRGRKSSIQGTSQLHDVIVGQRVLPALPRTKNESQRQGFLFSLISNNFRAEQQAKHPKDVVTDGEYLYFIPDICRNDDTSGWKVEESICLFQIKYPSNEVNKDCISSSSNCKCAAVDPKSVTITGLIFTSKFPCDKKHFPYCCSDGREVAGVECECIYSSPSPAPVVQLVQSKAISESLMKTITSMKLSSTSRFALIGYGIRAQGKLLYHDNQKTACEILDIQSNMKTSCIQTDDIDEVNNAQFNPLPSGGIIYGTKRGKLLAFKRFNKLK